jgi:hypothetical protein
MPTRHKHRVAVRIVDTREPAEAGWCDFEFLHANPDRRGALMAYLREQFTDRRAISETMDGTFVVVDPWYKDGSVTRYYRLT